MTDNTQKTQDALEALFQDARAAPPPVPHALMTRVLADAQQMQPRATPPARRGLWAVLADIGGLPALGGMITAGCVGFWLGVAPPQGMPDLATQVIGFESDTEDALGGVGLSGFGWDITEDLNDG